MGVNVQTTSPENVEMVGAAGYDFVIIDCPPSLGVLTVNSLFACDFIIIPCQISRYSLDGLADLLTTVEGVKALKPANIAVVGVANNVASGRQNILKSLAVLDADGIAHVGAGRSHRRGGSFGAGHYGRCGPAPHPVRDQAG